MAPVCSRPPFSSFLAAACIVCCCFLIRPLPACCSSDGGAAAALVHDGQTKRDAVVDIVGRALICFNDRYIYSACQGSFRLGPSGALGVPPGSADAFCGGPCLPETELVLRCVDGIMANFRFYNGASAADVRFALDRGCGHSPLRGDFEVLQHDGGGGYFYGDARRRSAENLAPVPLLLLSAATAVLVWA